jgi:hypothetical protein
MQAATAEVQFETYTPEGSLSPGLSAIRVDHLEQDRLIQADAAHFIGKVLTEQEGSVGFVEEDSVSLLSAIQEAAEGNSSALPIIRNNALTATLEGIYKSGHVITIESEIRDDGAIVQYGQSHTAVYRNALKYTSRFAPMLGRTKVETVNGHRIAHYTRTGILNDYYLLVPSLCPDDMTKEQMDEAGFFSASMTAVLQATTIKDNKLITESAFVAGVKEENNKRHDIEAVKALYEYYGQSAEGLSVTELLARPLLIPKEDMPNGVIDVVKIFDRYSGGFFGSNKEPQDYKEYMEVCREREAGLDTTINNIIKDLINSVDSLHKPIDAINRLYELVKKHALEYVVSDEQVDISIFGPEAAHHIEKARVFRTRGDMVAMNSALAAAEEIAVFSMCGVGSQRNESNLKDNQDLVEKEIDSSDRTESNTGKIRCFKCRKIVDKKDVVKEKTWYCPKCEYEVDICTGEVKNEGHVAAQEKPEEAKIYYLEDLFRSKQEHNKE